jgi:glycosyltransferase involved in cell wall biosynthesis
VRVKLLEAFAVGIPVVSTRLGAEGLASSDGEICALADDPDGFAQKTLALIQNPGAAEAMARRARQHVVDQRDIPRMTQRLLDCYQAEVRRARGKTEFKVRSTSP